MLQKNLPQTVRFFGLTSSHRLLLSSRRSRRRRSRGFSFTVVAIADIIVDRSGLAIAFAASVVTANSTADSCQSPPDPRQYRDLG